MPVTINDLRARSTEGVATTRPRATRLVSIDIVRGAVMILMAIDHVRVYSGLPAGGPTPGIFFTRWVTHFCAPAFVFLAGASAFLSGRRRPRGDLARHLLTRGAWLILLELTVIRIAWTFNFDFAHYLLAGVIWMIGWCMILLAGVVWLPTTAIALLGLVVIGAQDAVPVVSRLTPESFAWLWRFVYFGGVFSLRPQGPAVAVLYSIVPWVGVMAIGYAFGGILIREPFDRRRLCLWIGISATAAFLVVGGAEIARQPAARAAAPLLFRLLSQRKYPASQLFLLMTLGPTIAFLAITDQARGTIAGGPAVFGRVPFFYYLLHIPLIHAVALVVSLVGEGRVNPWLFANHPMMPPPVPAGYVWSLPLLYLVLAVVVAVLYRPCRYFAELKNRSGAALVRYL